MAPRSRLRNRSDQIVATKRMAKLVVGQPQRLGGRSLVEAIIGQRLGQQLALEPGDARLEVGRADITGRHLVAIAYRISGGGRAPLLAASGGGDCPCGR